VNTKDRFSQIWADSTEDLFLGFPALFKT